jgi:glycosyltransferase involved in cell wall biosynthesis
MPSPQILVHSPIGNAFVRALLTALSQADLLQGFYTTVAVTPEDEEWLSFLPHALSRDLRRRSYTLPKDKIHLRPLRQLLAVGTAKLKMSDRLPSFLRHWLSIYEIGKDLDLAVARQLPRLTELQGVYAYEDAAAFSFRAAEKLGLKRFYDLPIGYWQAGQDIQKEEAELNPEWAVTMPAIQEPAEKLARKDEEIQQADRIFVASHFTRQTLHKIPDLKTPVHVIPYGAPPPRIPDKHLSTPVKKLQVLFVGSLGQRKGVSYLFQAIELLAGQVDLNLIGLPIGSCPGLTKALQTYRWLGSIPHQEVLQEMQRNDVLVFPSLFEGFGLVILEAMACGLPVITTPHTAGPDVITDGEDGFIVPIRSAIAIAEKLTLLDQDRDRLYQMGQAALRKSQQFSWESYGQGILSIVRQSFL